MTKRYTDAEKQAALATLQSHNGNVAAAAREVGIPAATLRKWRGTPPGDLVVQPLTDKQLAFVQHYVRLWNATQAAIAAGYSRDTAYSIGHENLQKPAIRAAIQVTIERSAMSADEALARLAAIARGSVADLTRIDERTGAPSVDWTNAIETGAINLIKSLSITEKGVRFEMYDAQTALVHIIKEMHLRAGEVTERLGLDLDLMGRFVAKARAKGYTPDEALQALIWSMEHDDDAEPGAAEAGAEGQ